MKPTPTAPDFLLSDAGHRARVNYLGLAVVVLLTVAVAVAVDWFTGPEVAFSIIYLLPVSLAAWRGGRWFGLTTAIISGVSWLGVELMTNSTYSSNWIPYWNGSVRLSIFCVVAALVAEVAERKRVEAALNHQRGILQSILDTMREGIIVADHNGRLLLLNPTAEEFLDLDQNRPRPATSKELFAALERERGSASKETELALARALRGELLTESEFLLRGAGIKDRWLRIHARPWLDPAGRHHGTLIVLSDFTARRTLERQIAEVSDREQRRLGQDLHDGLCQDLVSTTFASRMLADKLSEKKLPEQHDAARIVELLDAAITQAREVARGLYLVEMDSSGFASALEELAAGVRAHSGVHCEFQESCTGTLGEVAQANDLFRIAQEAVSNAVKHSGASNIHITLERGDTGTTLRVTDDGSGISSQRGKQEGLGMHMMRYRARMMGGEFDVRSKPGNGTTVSCTLPRWTPPVEFKEPIHASA